MSIVCGTDLSERSRPALAAAAALARRAREPLHLVHVVVAESLEPDLRERLVAAAGERLAREAERIEGSVEGGPRSVFRGLLRSATMRRCRPSA
jgi:nucleotide-binding universal stress UspA family protein